ncbi:hypothetical protein [Flavivirga jejuensis]|uniref:Dolichyl-phosphate-mannose-protein mannosyltransferase n=1 Tax=Flavivirga jejuensis TaxID=870487 RepID=A0ABT8WU01_9FLAO|nr:hypothetical protein [Flavivirga jejuensis]MDO5976652.1 hypothetical protein [Flavivirga jejuensis]
MDKIWKITGNKKLLYGLSIIALLVYIFLIAVNTPKIFVFHNNDDYKGAFLRFLDLGHYDAVSEGTTILYNLFLKGLYWFTNDVEISFFLLNFLSQIFLIVFGFYFLRKKTKKIDIYFIILFGLYFFFTINLKSYSGASNDTFLGVFIIVLLYVLTQRLFNKKDQYMSFVLIGLLLAIGISIRMTALLWILLVAFTFIIWFVDSNDSIPKKILKIAVALISFIVLVSAFHYPSFIEKNKLSSYDKAPKNINANWVQRNYLGLKKIEQGKEAPNRDAIWKHTKFDVVIKYLDENGEDSLPKSFFEVISRDPVIVLKMFAYNVGFSILRFFRFWGFLFFLLLVPLLNKKMVLKSFINKENLASNLFLIITLALSFVCFTFIEHRWLIGYEILIPAAVLSYISRKPFAVDTMYKNTVFSMSLIVITLFNLRSILNLILAV